jgi:hypothetical protein
VTGLAIGPDQPLPITAEGEGERQLALYPYEGSARVAARGLRAGLTACPRRTVEPADNVPGAYRVLIPRQAPGTVVVAIAQWGNSVSGDIEGSRLLISRPESVTRAQHALTANRPLVCEVAEGRN